MISREGEGRGSGVRVGVGSIVFQMKWRTAEICASLIPCPHFRIFLAVWVVWISCRWTGYAVEWLGRRTTQFVSTTTDRLVGTSGTPAMFLASTLRRSLWIHIFLFCGG